MKKLCKKLSVATVLAVAMLFCFTASVLAAESGDFVYEVADGQAVITGYTGDGGAVTIPSDLGGYSVVSIGEFAFEGCESLTDVTIPNGVSSIGDRAFAGCKNLKNVTIPESTASIGWWAFINCEKLSSFTIDAANANYSSQDGVLFNMAKTELIQYPIGNERTAYSIPNSVISIANYAFSDCTLESITMPDGLQTIGAIAFSGCDNLTEISIPNSVTTIKDSAFASCMNLTSVTIPASVTSIGESAFGGCGKLASFVVSTANSSYASVDGVLFDKSNRTLIQYPNGRTGTSYAVPNGVTTIGVSAFSNNVHLTSVTVPGSVSNIESNAFHSCIISGITLANGLKSIGGLAFGYCNQLVNITFPESVTDIDSWAFYACEKLEKALFRGNAPTIFDDTFEYCKSSFTVYYLEGKTGFTNPWYGYPTVAVSTTLAAPTSVKASSASYSSIKVSWKAVGGAGGYEVWRAASSAGTYTRVGKTTSTGFSNTGLTTGKTYYYKVRAYLVSGASTKYGGYSSIVSAKPVPAAPGSVKAAPASYNSIKVTWGKVAGVTKYEVYRATSKSGAYKLLTATTAVSYINKSVNTGTTYFYKVRAYRLVSGKKVFGPYSAAVSAKTILPIPTSVKAARTSSSSIRITWKKVTGATKYEVWRSMSQTGTYARITTTASAYYSNTKLVAGKYYYYKVKAYRLVGSKKVYSGWSAVVKAKP